MGIDESTKLVVQNDEREEIKQKDTFSVGKFMVTGGGFMLDQYNLFIISPVLDTMKNTSIGDATDTQKLVIKGLSLIGAIFGQLIFGTVADVVGRKTAFMTTLTFVVLGSILSGSIPACTEAVSGHTAYWLLGVFQFLLGFGVGGEYPLSASVSRESSPDFKKIGYTFCMQGVGFILGPIIFLILSEALFTGSGSEDQMAIWRGALLFSAIPGLMLVYPRAKMLPPNAPAPDSVGFMEAMRSHQEINEDGVMATLSASVMWRRLIGTAGSWFLFDISFYGNAILASDAFSLIGIKASKDATPHHKVTDTSLHMLIVAGLGLPGYVVSLIMVSRMGLWRIQMFGFLMMAVTFFLLAVLYHELKESTGAFLFVYGLTFFFSNFGPNYTTYILPTLLFPKDIRARCHGLSAALGKTGAAVGVYVLASIMNHYDDSSSGSDSDAEVGFHIVAGICAGVGIFGAALTWLCIPRNAEEIGKSMNTTEGSYITSEEE